MNGSIEIVFSVYGLHVENQKLVERWETELCLRNLGELLPDGYSIFDWDVPGNVCQEESLGFVMHELRRSGFFSLRTLSMVCSLHIMVDDGGAVNLPSALLHELGACKVDVIIQAEKLGEVERPRKARG